MVTMSKIAERVGVSQATVSYVLNNRNNGISIRPETRQRILDTASEMGYRRNDLARAMVTGKNFVLGFLTRNPGDEGAARMMVGAQEEANRGGYFIKLLPVPADGDYRACIERSIEQRLAGILVQNLAPAMLELLRTEAHRYNIPVVLIDDVPPEAWATRVTSDDELGIREAIAHLRELGHRRIGFVAAQAHSVLSQARTAAFRAAMAEAGLNAPDAHICWTDWRKADVIEREVGRLLSGPGDKPTALLCAGDLIAMTTLRTARQLGFALPQQLSVVGFADFLMAEFADPPLTTIAQPFEAMGRAAVQALLERGVPAASAADLPVETAPGAGEPAPILLPAHLKIRASTARPVF